MDDFRPPRAPLVSPGQIEIFPRDMTATLSADMILAEAQEKLAEFDQWLPIDGNPSLSIARLVEENSTGPLRLGYGAWRDLLLGCQFHNTAGELITAGGRVVKNVAGYDLTKFMIGQRGVFGRIVTITTRTYRRPAAALLARFALDVRLTNQLLLTPLRPQWALLTADALFCGYVGSEIEIDYWQSNVPVQSPIELLRRSLQDDMAHRAALFRWPSDVPGSYRASIPPARLAHLAHSLSNSWTADPAFGVIVGEAGDEPARKQLTQVFADVGGTVIFADAPLLASFSDPAAAQLIERLRLAFAQRSSSHSVIESGGER